MSDTYEHSEPLGVGALISRTFSVFFRHVLLFMAIAFVPTLVVGLVSLALMPDLMGFGSTGAIDPNFTFPTTAFAIVTILSLVVYLLVIGVSTLAAYDVSLGRPTQFGAYISRTLASALPIVVLGLVYYILISLGLLLLILPGLYILAMFYVLVPAILVERAGFSGLSRAASLSKGYRWPVLGSIIVVFLLTVIVSIIVNMVAGVVVAMTGSLVVSVVIQSVVNALAYGLTAVFAAVLYARLRELKEGVGMSDLVSVFE
ncbi:hypothetical protein [Algicella marina]|uniref:Glycerophosphoryl diester phosphodiesterase membrane domain-containing protein n=1 Tax=Algicella marina TaxID=2683284 RepID=A0A6P1SV23_9RHOB|nr:hypothetical protein [Algicella marina]QHQ34544.1 hypothetical protein GO499_04730 [Algicella marina]